MKLTNTNALVAGATRGIGLAIARSLAARGVRLVLPWHDDWLEDAKSLQDEFAGSKPDHIIIKADLRNQSEVDDMAAAIREKAGTLHILINNIERGGMPVVHGSYNRELNREQWQLELDTTLLAKRLVFEACLPLLKKADQASVINISSIAGITGRSGPAALLFSDGYAAANRGIGAFTETWARMGAPSVRVNELMLGLIETRHGRKTRGWQALSSKQKKQLRDHTLLARIGTPEDVVDAVLYLLRKGDFMTGATLRLDGGFVLGGENVPPMPEGIL